MLAKVPDRIGRIGIFDFTFVSEKLILDLLFLLRFLLVSEKQTISNFKSYTCLMHELSHEFLSSHKYTDRCIH